MSRFSRIVYPQTNIRGVEFWCSDCDHNKVHSDKPETGQFYTLYGHERFGSGTITAELVGLRHPIMFALCHQCDHD